ncbi:hypothetical protein VTI74DRAFT_9200 [Chaetomium olivicolor]
MHPPILFEPGVPFHVGSYRPAINLVEDQPQGIESNILLLGCGDARNILYTLFTERGFPDRRLDFTACDIDENTIARNILLFTFILDDEKDVSPLRIWNIYYHFYLDNPDMVLVCTQAAKLVGYAKSLEVWHASPYGNTLRFCDEGTLSLVRAVWEKFADSVQFRTFSNEHHCTPYEKSLADARFRQCFSRQAQEKDVARSVAPLADEFARDMLISVKQNWERGLACGIPLSQPQAEQRPPLPNPVFAVPLIASSILEFPTDPLLSFHLAAGLFELTDLSPLRPQDDTDVYPGQYDQLFRTAMVQFKEWIEAFREAAARTVIRFTASDCFAFCYTLRNVLEAEGETCAHWYQRNIGFDVLKLSDTEYGSGGRAPLAFNVIDTSTLSDQTSILSLLVAAAPLLEPSPYATLYTQGAYNMCGPNSFETLLEGHTTTLSTILGLVPAEYWTNAKADSMTDELLMALTQKVHTPGCKGIIYGNRIAWKQSRFISGRPVEILHAKNDDLAALIKDIYRNALHTPGPVAGDESERKLVRRYGPWITHHAASFTALLRALADCTGTNYAEVFDEWLDLMTRSDMATTARRHMGTLLTYMQPSFETDENQYAVQDDHPQYGFRKWEQLPSFFALTMVVPYEKWKRLPEIRVDPHNIARMSFPALLGAHIRSQDKKDMLGMEMLGLFLDIQISFGTITTQGARDKDDFTVLVEENKAAWKGTSPMVVTFNIPKRMAETISRDVQIGLHLCPTGPNPDGLLQAEEEMDIVFETAFANLDHIFLTKYRPGKTGHETTDGRLRRRRVPVWVDPANSLEPPFTANFEKGDIVSITGRLDITSDRGKELLASKVPIALQQSSPFAINIVFGKKELVLTLPFPIPVSQDGSRTRIARKSAYIEIIAPLAKPSAFPRTLDDLIFPSTLFRHGSDIPIPLNIPNLNLDNLPILKLGNKRRTRFITTLTSLSFSSRERRIREQEAQGNTTGLTSSARLNFKESLFTIFMLASGLQGGQTGLFALTHPQRGGIHMLLFVSAIRLDGSHASIVLDAAVLPFTKALIDSGELESFLLLLRTLECCTLTVDDAELLLWKKNLPALADRCRTYAHDPATCEYNAPAASVPLSLTDGARVLCSCGQGKLPANFIPIPEWDAAAKHATRVAISPAFASPLVEELIDPALAKAMDERKSTGDARTELLQQCRNCGRTEEERADPPVKLKKCARCLEVAYCSPQCQKADWRKHRMECQEAEVHREKDGAGVKREEGEGAKEG